MAILTDLVVAEPTEASAVLSTSTHSAWTSLESKGLDTIKLGTLAFILQGKDVDDVEAVVDYSEFEMLATGGDEGPWVFRVPADLVESLATLEVSQATSVSAIWAATEELEMDGWSEEDAATFLDILANFARSAGGKSVLLWMSL